MSAECFCSVVLSHDGAEMGYRVHVGFPCRFRPSLKIHDVLGIVVIVAACSDEFFEFFLAFWRE